MLCHSLSLPSNTQAHGMVSPPAEQKQLLLKSLESMPSTEHERYLGDKLYPLVQVHITPVYCPSYTRLVHQTGMPRAWQAVDPVRAGKITGMLLEMDVPLNVHKIVALIVSPDMVRSTLPGSRLHSLTRPVTPGAAATGHHQRGADDARLWR